MDRKFRRVGLLGILGLSSVGMGGAIYGVATSEDGQLWTRLDEATVRGGACYAPYPTIPCPDWGSDDCVHNGECDGAHICQTLELTATANDYHPGYIDGEPTGFLNVSYHDGNCKIIHYCEKNKACDYKIGVGYFCKRGGPDNQGDFHTKYNFSGQCPPSG